jgi:hypothetical protein
MSDESREAAAHSDGDRIVAKAGNDSVIEGDWRTMERLAKAILREAEGHKPALEKIEEMGAGVHARLKCDNCDITDEAERVRDLIETPEEHVDHPDFDCTLDDVTVEAFCPRHGTIPLDYDECEGCADTRAVMNR